MMSVKLGLWVQLHWAVGDSNSASGNAAYAHHLCNNAVVTWLHVGRIGNCHCAAIQGSKMQQSLSLCSSWWTDISLCCHESVKSRQWVLEPLYSTIQYSRTSSKNMSSLNAFACHCMPRHVLARSISAAVFIGSAAVVVFILTVQNIRLWCGNFLCNAVHGVQSTGHQVTKLSLVPL